MTVNRRTRRWGLGSALFGKSKARAAARSRRRLLWLDNLETRIAPAVAGTLYVAGTTLVYNGNFADNNITVSGTGGSLTINDTAGTITSTVPGFSSGAGPITGTIPSYIQTIAIQGQNGTDVVNDSGLQTVQSLILSATTVNLSGTAQAKSFDITGTTVTNSGSLDTTQAGPIAGSVLITGTFDNTSIAAPTINTDGVLDGNVTFDGSVEGSASLVVNAGPSGNITALNSIVLGGASSLSLTGDNVNLHQIITGIDGTGLGASITAQNAVNLNGSLITTGTVAILANQGGSGPAGFTQVSGDIITTSQSAVTGDSAVQIVVNVPLGGSGSGTGNITLNGITAGAGAVVSLSTGSSASTGGAIVNGGGPGALNVNVPGALGTLTLQAGPGGIDLDTSVSIVSATVAATGTDQLVTINNTGLALSVAGVTTSGDVSISNNETLTLVGVSAGGNINLTTTNGADVSATAAVYATTPGDTLTINSAGAINAVAIGASNMVLTAATGIGTTGGLLIDTPYVPSVTLTASTTSGGIAATGVGIGASFAGPLIVNQATASSGDINLENFTGDLIVNGNVSTASGGDVTLSTLGNNITVNSGSITSDSGAITLSSLTGNLTLAASVDVSTTGAITLTSLTGNLTLAASMDVSTTGAIIVSAPITDIAGTVAGGSVDVSATSLLSVQGTVAVSAAGTLSLGGASVMLLGGTITAGSGSTTTITPGISSTLIMNGLLQTGGAITIASAVGPITMTLSGTISNSSGGITIEGALVGSTVINMSGTTTSSGAVAITGESSTDPMFLTTTGPITGSTVAITGNGLLGSNAFTIGGPVTATAGTASDLTITDPSSGDDSIVITGPLNTGSNLVAAVLTGGTGSDLFVLTPSTASPFSVVGTGGTSSVQIVTALANILTSSTAGVTFTTASGLQDWTFTNIASVAPTVP